MMLRISGGMLENRDEAAWGSAATCTLWSKRGMAAKGQEGHGAGAYILGPEASD